MTARENRLPKKWWAWLIVFTVMGSQVLVSPIYIQIANGSVTDPSVVFVPSFIGALLGGAIWLWVSAMLYEFGVWNPLEEKRAK